MSPAECDVYVQQARSLLYILDSCPLRDVSPSTVRECTALFLEAYPKLYAVEAITPVHLSLHEETLAAIQKRLSTLDAMNDVLFGYVLEFQVTVVVLYTSPCSPLVALHKNPKLPAFHITSRSFQLHQLDIPLPFEPDRLQATANCMVEDIGYALLHDPEAFSATRATLIVHSLSKVARLRPVLWPHIIPVICRITTAIASGDTPSHTLQAPSVRYAVRCALVLLVRIPKASRWRPQVQAALEAVTATFDGSQLLSSNHEETLKSYLRGAAKEGLSERQALERKRERAEALAAKPKRPKLSLAPPPTEVPDDSAATPLNSDADDFPIALNEEVSPAPTCHLGDGVQDVPEATTVAATAEPDPTLLQSPVPPMVQCLLATLKHVDVRGLRQQHKEGVQRIVQRMVALYSEEVRRQKAG